MKISMQLEEFKQLAKNYTVIPLYTEILADLETPVSAFMKIRRSSPSYAFLLESVVGGEQIARYSFLGVHPYRIFLAKKNEVVWLEKGKKPKTIQSSNPISLLKEHLKQYKAYPDPSLPPFFGGAVGYFSYDAVRYLEKLPDLNDDDRDIPYLYFMFTDSLILFDHVEHRLKIIHNVNLLDSDDSNKDQLDEDQNKKKLYQKAQDEIRLLTEQLQTPLDPSQTKKRKPRPLDFKANLTQEKFQDLVKKAKEYIRQGDIYQMQLSRRLELPIDDLDSFQIYRALRAVNPSPYMFYLKFDLLELIGSSPELLIKSQNKRIIARPIAGTRRRGKDLQDELKMEKELKKDEKENAEHIMLVDLARNDLGRVCQWGTVKPTEMPNTGKQLMIVEKYSHVMHLVSEIEGILLPDHDPLDALCSFFPSGTLSGAPKIRAMEIIEELEPVKRGPYGGGIISYSFLGELDSTIIIRTILIQNKIAYLQTAAGIVFDSIPEQEFIETQNKAMALFKAMELAQEI